MEEWLNTEYEEHIKITVFEREFLLRLAEDYQYLARDKDNRLWAYRYYPMKDKEGWFPDTNEESDFAAIPRALDNFSGIKWSDEKPTDIEEIIENCEVIS